MELIDYEKKACITTEAKRRLELISRTDNTPVIEGSQPTPSPEGMVRYRQKLESIEASQAAGYLALKDIIL